MQHDHSAEKEKFQLDRIALFSDAIFAIAITLLIIEIKVPEVHAEELDDEHLLSALGATMPKFIGFVISFFVIGLYWLAHHRMFRYAIRSSQKLLWNNLLFMFPIVLMPFSTAFLSEYYNINLRLPLIVYTVNICLSGFFSYRLWKIISNPKNRLSSDLHPVMVRYNITRALSIPIIFVSACILSYINPHIAYLMPLLTMFVSMFIRRYYTKKYPAVMAAHLE